MCDEIGLIAEDCRSQVPIEGTRSAQIIARVVAANQQRVGSEDFLCKRRVSHQLVEACCEELRMRGTSVVLFRRSRMRRKLGLLRPRLCAARVFACSPGWEPP